MRKYKFILIVIYLMSFIWASISCLSSRKITTDEKVCIENLIFKKVFFENIGSIENLIYKEQNVSFDLI